MNFDDGMLDVYIYENQQLLETLESVLLEAEKDGALNSEHINEIFRIMHTVKGSSSMMELNNLAHVSHAAEDLFSYIREHGTQKETMPAIFDIAFGVTSFLNGELAKLSSGQPSEDEAPALIKKIMDLLGEISGAADTGAGPDPVTSPVPAMAPVVSGDPFYKIKVSFEEDCKMESIRALGLVTALTPICANISHTPADLSTSDADGEIIKNGFTLIVQSAENPDSLEKIVEETIYVQNYSVLPIESDDEDIPHTLRTVKTAVKSGDASGPAVSVETIAKQNFISVNVNKLDSLLNLVGEIVTAESMVINNQDLANLQLDNFNTAASQLKSLINELQDIVMSIRMLPISTVFQKMKRIVRDMSKKFDKQIDLILIGEETEVDKNVIDSLSDPLMHIIRNSADHGIEEQGARIKAGKYPKGKITLEAKTTGSDVVVAITDDGKGLDRDAIIKKALEKGLINKPESEISDKEAYSMIFLPGFSTKEEVTEYSGRGVGMDVVRRNIAQIGGTLTVDSAPGRGTEHVIRIPLTLTIVDGIKFMVGHQSFILPTLSIKETFKPVAGAVFTDPQRNEMVKIREDFYSVLRLNEYFGIEGAVTNPEDGMLINVETEERNYCILIDTLEGEHQVVVKSLPSYLHQCTTGLNGISGCAILGDGSINLILDANALAV